MDHGPNELIADPDNVPCALLNDIPVGYCDNPACSVTDRSLLPVQSSCMERLTWSSAWSWTITRHFHWTSETCLFSTLWGRGAL